MHIKLFTSRLSVLLALCALVAMSSCKKDDDVKIPVVKGINVSDGFYIAKSGSDPTSSDVLVSENVEDDGFTSQERNGFVANYVYLAAGNYNLVEIKAKAISKTYGGTMETITDTGSGCDYNDYSLVNLTENGATFTVDAGLYKLSYDATTSEMVLYQIETPGIIGSATPGGWGSDVAFTGTVSATGGSWSATDVTLREGVWKLRFNCRWGLDRRVDPAAGFDAANGYLIFTNFGGSIDNLLTGNNGSNIPIAADAEGIYTVDITWKPGEEFKITTTKTGDVNPITFVPDDHQWAIVGDSTNPNDDDNDGTADGWQVDTDMNYEGFDSGSSTYTWKITSISLVPGGFKFRTNDAWLEDMGWGGVELVGDVSDFTDDNGNIKVSTAASYEIILTTSDDGGSYRASFTQL